MICNILYIKKKSKVIIVFGTIFSSVLPFIYNENNIFILNIFIYIYILLIIIIIQGKSGIKN